MSSKLFASLALVGAASFGLGLDAKAAVAGGSNEPGSLLVFPMFDNTRGGNTVITVTNTNDDTTPVGNLFGGSVVVEFVYINGYTCQEFNRTRPLTPNDTITVLSKYDNPNQQKGYVYVFAKSPTTGKAIKFDFLIGNELLIDATDEDITTSLNPFVFKAGEALAHGANTDLENGVGDGIRDLNDLEYQQAPDQILIPRFFGQDEDSDGSLVLINLTGGEEFTAILDLLVYNDNEEVFSAQFDFECWKHKDLRDISNVFDQDFLKYNTNHNPAESVLDDETGWFKMDGNVAFSTNTSIPDPAFLAVLLCEENVEDKTGALPFTLGAQDNGDLLPSGILGDVQ